MDYYSAMLAEKEQQTVRQERSAGGQTRTISGTGEASFEDISLLNEQDKSIDVVSVGDRVTLQVVISVNVDIPRLVLGFMIKDRMGQAIYGINNSSSRGRLWKGSKAGEKVTYRFAFPAPAG